jgi:16S rRNA (cytosine1402-N4)-methyltransferase
MNEKYHISVLSDEVIHYLDPQAGKVYVDATFGGGGHTRRILSADPGCKVIAIDWDTNAIEKNGIPLQEEFPGRLTFVWGNFANILNLLKKIKVVSVDGILADFGTSQYQIKEQAGFSVYKDTPLDMRMSPSHQKLTAQELINKGTEKKLKEIFWKYGEERYTNKIVDQILIERKRAPIKTTVQLAKIVERVVLGSSLNGKRKKIHPATKIFQALRIFINSELENIHSLLSASLTLLNNEGKLVCISFHSLEDRMVKQFLKDHPCDIRKGFKILTPKAIIASEQELKENPASRSAKLRAAQVCQGKL